MSDGAKELASGSDAQGEQEQFVQFYAPGVRGEVLWHPHPEGGGMIQISHIMVDSKQVAARMDPRFFEELEKQFGSDEAMDGWLRSEAEQWVERLIIYEALVTDAEAKGDVAFVTEAKAALKRTRKGIALRFKNLPLLREAAAVPPPASVETVVPPTPLVLEALPAPAPVQEVKTVDPALVNPDELQFADTTVWTPARQEAARNVIRYHQGLVSALQEELDAYALAHADDPRIEALRQNLVETRGKALQTDEYSVQDMVRRITANDPGAIPTIELVPGAKTVQESAHIEAKQLFESWMHA